MTQDVDFAVAGRGLAGALSALALARQGHRVALIGRPVAIADGRTTALMQQSVDFVRSFGLTDAVEQSCAPLAAIRIIDGTHRLLRAPTVQFRAAEVGLDRFGDNVPNSGLLAMIEAKCGNEPTLSLHDINVADVKSDAHGATLVLEDGTTLTAGLVVAADGRASVARKAAGIGERQWSYPQTAIVLNFAHTVPHRNVSNEFHTETGPCTQVPLSGDRSSLVWVVSPEQASDILTMTHDALARAIEGRLSSLLGKIAIESAPQAFPLSGMVAHRFGRDRTVLVGEAGHAFPPIGAQGLNLGIRDIMTLVGMTAGSAVDLASIAGRYDTKRRADVLTRTFSVDMLNRSLLSDFLPVQALRTAGLHLLSAAGPLRAVMMREGISPGSAWKDFRDGLSRKAGQSPADSGR